MGSTEAIIKDYWNELPREMRVELIQEGRNSVQIMERAARELDIEFEPSENDSRVRKEDVAEFAVAVMDKYIVEGGPYE